MEFFQKADKSEMLSELYERIYIYDQFDKTDTDGDGLYDIVETAGIRLCNGQIIYTDPNLPDSDGDKLDDGVEIDPVPTYTDKFRLEDEIIVHSSELVFGFSSNPELIDTDFDGAHDDKDFTPNVINPYISYIFYPKAGEDFLENEADVRYKRMTNKDGKMVQKFATTDIDDFEEHWNQMGIKGGKIAFQIDEVHLIYHGGPRTISIFDGGNLCADNSTNGIQYIYVYGDKSDDMIINDLEQKNINYLNLSSCNNGNIDFDSNDAYVGFDDNMAISFLKSKHNIKRVSAWDGNAVYEGFYVNILGADLSIQVEFAKMSESFTKWSRIVNGKDRRPKGKLIYYKDNTGSVVYRKVN
ncbi:MAG: hypothetical protein E7258_02735 [Lachnospiraceae bacterium]|nr:hypothetical protein [Lachnospiraceae bacterium]